MKTGRVIILDDDRFDRMLVRRAVEKLAPGMDIREFAHAEEALDFLRTGYLSTNEVFIIDIVMPKNDGFDFIDSLWKLCEPGLREGCIAVLSASIHPAYRERAGTDPRIGYYFEKPVREEDLARMLADLNPRGDPDDV